MIIETNENMKSKVKAVKNVKTKKESSRKMVLYINPILDERLIKMENTKGIKDTSIAIFAIEKYLTENNF